MIQTEVLDRLIVSSDAHRVADEFVTGHYEWLRHQAEQAEKALDAGRTP